MAKILDQYGNPIDSAALGEPQTAQVSVLKNTFLTSFMSGLDPSGLADMLHRADMGYLVAQHRVFSDMEERDPHLFAEMSKRKQAPLNLDWQVVPPPNASAAEKANAEWVEETLRDAIEPMEDLLLAMMDAVGHGFAPVEQEWVMEDGQLLPIFHPRPQEWFRLTIDRRELRLIDGSSEGAVLQPFGWIQHTLGKAKTGYLGRMGLYRVLVWPFLYKAYAVSDFAEFLEAFGLPMIVGKYGTNASAEQKESLFRAVSDLGHAARAIMPVDMQIEIQKVTGGSGASGTPHLSMIDWADRAQSKAILGQVLSAEAKNTGMGSGVAKLHDAVRLDIKRSDARQLGATLTRDLVYPLIALNRGGLTSMRRCPRLVFDTNDLQDIEVFSTALSRLSPLFDIPTAWARERLGIPAPKDGEECLKSPPPGKTPEVPPVASLAALSAQSAPAVPTGIAADDDAMEAAAQPAVDDLVGQIQKVVDSTPDLASLQATLVEAYGDLDSDRLTAVMTAAFALAELKGMANAQ